MAQGVAMVLIFALYTFYPALNAYHTTNNSNNMIADCGADSFLSSVLAIFSFLSPSFFLLFSSFGNKKSQQNSIFNFQPLQPFLRMVDCF